MRRGEIWWASLGVPTRSEPGFRRPVLIVQSNPFNESKIHTVVVAAITTNQRLAEAPGNVALRRRDSKLPKASIINVSQILTVDRSVLSERVTKLPSRMMSMVDAGLRSVLAL